MDNIKFDYSRLQEQITEKAYYNFLDYFSQNDNVRSNIIQKVEKDGIYTEPLETGTSKIGFYESIDFTSITFEKVDNNTIEVYINQNSFGTLS